jgi:hypothetical protein
MDNGKFEITITQMDGGHYKSNAVFDQHLKVCEVIVALEKTAEGLKFQLNNHIADNNLATSDPQIEATIASLRLEEIFKTKA